MRKKGFTLAETLITLGIIGVTAALISPALRQLIPNKDKMEFMECYKLLTSSIPVISTHYYPEYSAWDHDGDSMTPPRQAQNCVGMGCLGESNGCSGDKKFQCLLEKIANVRKYTWSVITEFNTIDGPQSINPVSIKYTTKHEATCYTPSKKSFIFYLKGNGKISGFDENGKKFIKDQFNYYNKGDEEEEE